MTHDVSWCLEHQVPSTDKATHCGFVYWVESRHSVEQAAREAEKCDVVPAVLTVSVHDRAYCVRCRDAGLAQMIEHGDFIDEDAETDAAWWLHYVERGETE